MVVAPIQTKGRGRRNNVWYSARGGLWASFMLPSIIPEAEMTMLNISCGLACARACERMLKGMEYSEEHPFIRWPNDIMLRDKKLGGMLIEVKSEGSGNKTFILGVGINVNQKEFDVAIREQAISFYTVLGRRVSRMRLLFLILKELETMISYVREKGTEGLLHDWQQYSYELGKHIEIMTGKEAPQQGKVIGLGKRGELTIIDENDEISSIYHGFSLKILDK
jgi:BirA family biotin operon repressor/biotin-[acetyl-CoA-carboxylase] ligase